MARSFVHMGEIILFHLGELQVTKRVLINESRTTKVRDLNILQKESALKF
jgi:hypothetical protein